MLHMEVARSKNLTHYDTRVRQSVLEPEPPRGLPLTSHMGIRSEILWTRALETFTSTHKSFRKENVYNLRCPHTIRSGIPIVLPLVLSFKFFYMLPMTLICFHSRNDMLIGWVYGI